MGESSGHEESVVAHLYNTVSDWAGNSRLVQFFDGLSDRFAVATAESRISGAASTVGDWIRASWTYRWLTAEPDPDVIVIDLRETYTVGPIIRLLDRIVTPLSCAWEGSGAQASVDAVADAPVRALGVVVAVAVLVETALSLVVGDLGQTGLRIRALLFGFAVLATQVSLSASELAETRPGRLLRAVLEPPEPPGRATERPRVEQEDDDTDDRD
ncbi:hypothetical protein BV210_11185 [Halorientalis sp. IM1011]|uniref:hypothetical protein n=1 Tax=Halorientalis sp. IM1011 TaxID=1932360 RepID=UPI00097CD51B|nr:hypothetical protein [Halorientalis sp. IM1011]AQL43246.1 hypothetical protein BV210_11185 [Halorientalis sp. IM1011]